MVKAIAIFFIILSLQPQSSTGQSKDEKAIRNILLEQTAAWNNGNINNFMKGYWDRDSLMFIGKSGITYGWEKTLKNYKRGYPDTTQMGKLHFSLIQLKKISGNYFYVVGEWKLIRTIGNLAGTFTLLFRKINNTWVIVIDHSS